MGQEYNMSIATELENLETNISNAYNSVSIAGGTIPQNKNMENLPTAIESCGGVDLTEIENALHEINNGSES